MIIADGTGYDITGSLLVQCFQQRAVCRCRNNIDIAAALRQSRGIPEETVWIVRYYPQTDPVGIIEFRLKPTEEEIAEEQAAQSAAEPEQTLAEEAPAAPDAGSETGGK